MRTERVELDPRSYKRTREHCKRRCSISTSVEYCAAEENVPIAHIPQFSNGVNALLVVRQSVLLCLKPLLSGVRTLEEESIERRHDEAHRDESDDDTVTKVVVRRVLGAVNVRGDERSEITDTDLEGRSDSSLRRAGEVVREPGHDGGKSSVGARSDEEEAEVLHADRCGGDCKTKEVGLALNSSSV